MAANSGTTYYKVLNVNNEACRRFMAANSGTTYYKVLNVNNKAL